MDATRDALEQRWSLLGLGPDDFQPQQSGTIVERPALAATVQAPASTGFQPSAAPAEISSRLSGRVPEPVAAPDSIVLGPMLAEGGMGVVHVAEQPTLRREVAVKVLRRDRRTESATGALLREAWVVGTLEHPNIVPVHLLLREDDGSPRVVMKRIEGVAWDALIERPELVSSYGGTSAQTKDPLEFHLRVLIAVCHAIHFAHSRGIVHLDLKPDNVMVGRFGEVAVVDWGIAASFGERAPRWLPAAREIRGVRGTPAWMAPELAAADGPAIGPHTDVYLLGGMLHAILTKDVRHQGEDVKETLTHAYESAPFTYAADVPLELATLANAACHKEPGQRPASADAFRRGIEDFLSHRASTTLSDEAARRLPNLLSRLAERAGPTPAVSPGRQTRKEGDKADQSIRRGFLECQFAFQQALQIWPENMDARAGLQKLLRAMAEYALENRMLERAAECLHALDPGDPDLSRRLSALAREAVESQARLRTLERDADPNVHRRIRALMALATGLVFLVWNLVVGWLHRSGTFAFELGDLVWLNFITVGIFFLAAFVVRKTMLTTATNMRLVVLFGSGFSSVLVFWVAIWILTKQNPNLGLETLDVVAISSWIYIYFILALTFTMDRRVAWLAPPVAAIGILAPLFRPYAFELMGLGGFVCGSGLSFIWRTPTPPRARSYDDLGDARQGQPGDGADV